MQAEQNDIIAVPRALVGYICIQSHERAPGAVGIGTHGYLVTPTPAKKGYGLKNMIPSPHGYVKGEKGDLCVVDQVFDGILGKVVPEGYQGAIPGFVWGVNELLTFANDVGTKSVWIGLPRIQLVATLQSGLAKLVANGYTDKGGNPIPYADILKEYVRLFDHLTAKGVTITFGSTLETDMGTMAANNSAELALLKVNGAESNSFSLVKAEGYWNHDHKRHPLLGHPRLIFHSKQTMDGPPEYLYTMDYEKSNDVKKDPTKLEIEVGQNLAHARYAVVKPHVLDQLIVDVAKAHCGYHATKHSNLAVMYLSAVFSKQGNSLLTRFGSGVLANKTQLTELIDGKGLMYTHDMPIPRKSLRSVQVYAQMEDALKQFESAYYDQLSDLLSFGHIGFECTLGEVTATDITEFFCTESEDAKERTVYKPNKLIEQPNITLTVPGRLIEDDAVLEIPIKLTVGYDMPARNTIAALLGEGFKAFLLVYRDTEVTVRHLTVISSDKGVGIWTTPFAARTFTHALAKPDK